LTNSTKVTSVTLSSLKGEFK